MNWALIAAGCMSLAAAAIHGLVGDRIVRRIDNTLLPGNPFAGLSSKLLIRVSWHIVTITFAVLGFALVAVGARPQSAAAPGAAYVALAAFACWSVFAGFAGVKHAGVRAFRSHPAPLIFLLTVALIAWGATQL